jgi:parvulin-like peptidyl-prolyl isomerase
MKKIILFKHPIKKVIVCHLIALAVVVILGIISYCRFWNVAKVNGIGVSRIAYIKELEKQGGQQVLASMIDNTLILNEGKKNNVKVEQKDIDDQIATIETQLKSQNQTLDAALLASNMTKADLEKQIKIQKIESILSATKTEITQSQIDEFLKTNKSLLPTGKTKDELQTLAKEQLTLEANQSAATNWLDSLRQSAKIVYR